MSQLTLALITRTLQPRRGLAWHGGPTPSRALRGVDAVLARWRTDGTRDRILARWLPYWQRLESAERSR